MNTPCKMRKILILPNVANAPTLIGMYDTSCNLVESHTLEIPLSDGLVPFFVVFENKGVKFKELYFVRGPGSFMALKLIYLFAKTLQITKNIALYATDAFYFNNNSPIKAYGNCYFVKENVETHTAELHTSPNILLKTYNAPNTIPPIAPFALPKVLNLEIFSTELNPLYVLPPI